MKMLILHFVVGSTAVMWPAKCFGHAVNGGADRILRTQGSGASKEFGKVPTAKPLGKPDVTMDVSQWLAEFKEDSKAAKSKYKHKVVELSGTVAQVVQDRYGLVGFVHLKVEGDLQGVVCTTVDNRAMVIVSPGSKVKIRGKVSDPSATTGQLYPAEIVEAGPNPAVVVSAQKLAKEYGTNVKAAKEKYRDKYVQIDGEVLGGHLFGWWYDHLHHTQGRGQRESEVQLHRGRCQ